MVSAFDISSLRGKITTAYALIVLITLILGAIALFDLLFLEKQVTEGKVVSDLKDAILEMRRNEKNLFLYTDKKDLALTISQAALSIHIIQLHEPTLLSITEPKALASITALLNSYRSNLELWKATIIEARPQHEQRIRSQGHELYLFIEALAVKERQSLEIAVRKSRWFLFITLSLIGISIFMVGHQLIKHTVKPLKKLERQLIPLAKGQYKELIPPSEDREFVTFTKVFNQMLRDLEIRQKRLLNSEKLASLGILASGVAHELNNPLSNISTSCQLVMEELHEADEQQLQLWLSQIDRETERGQKIVRSLLDFGRQQNLEKSRRQLLGIISETLLFIRKSLLQHNTQLDINIADDLYIHADAQRIQQLFINLVQNALNATEADIDLRIAAHRFDPQETKKATYTQMIGNWDRTNTDDARFIQISIIDNGRGMDPEELKHIFDPFYTTSEPGHGVGLGLYIVQEIVNEHDGCLAINSTPGLGTEVSILLPEGKENTDD